MGSSNYITNFVGEVSQHIEYFAFGETFIEEHKNSHNAPYKFNGKELDEESGLYYYGARYYDSRISIWVSTDPLSGYNPIFELEHYFNGQHNGGVYNSFNHNTYGYCYQNPTKYVDPNGKQVDWDKAWNDTKEFFKDVGDVLDKTAETLSPITIHVKTNQEKAASKAKYGEGIIADFEEMWDGIINVPRKFEDQLDALADIDFDDLQKRFSNASGKEKATMAATVSVILLSLKKGKIDTKGLALLGFKNNFKIITANLLKKAGIDVHALKYDILGKKAKVSEYDLYKHTETKEILIIKKGGKGEPIHTGEYIKD